MRQRLILVAHHYSIEPLGILHLAGIARDLGWDARVVLIQDGDFAPLYKVVSEWRPNLVGLQVWTGQHLSMFAAGDKLRSMNIPVVIGGPHATYFDHECAKHADWVIRGGAFVLFAQLLNGQLTAGTHFSITGRADSFSFPDRAVVYETYAAFGDSPIKSIMASVGCPFSCTYCYAPFFNRIHGGFALTVRPVGEVVAEAQEIMRRWPLKMIYFQDDIFGYDLKWLAEFADQWSSRVGVQFHCQIRLELTRGDAGDERLDLFQRAGCSGITLAIESGNEFLRDHILFRHMPEDLIISGCAKIMSRGMTLRTEQILAVPFSDSTTDLATLRLNGKIEPTMAWTSILAPYEGTDMGTIAKNFGFYAGNNDDLADTFFDRSVLRHVAGGPINIAAAVQANNFGHREHPLVRMRVIAGEGLRERVLLDGQSVGEIIRLDDDQNARYCSDTARLQRLFMWLAKVPQSELLGRALLDIPDNEWNWGRIGEIARHHLTDFFDADRLDDMRRRLAKEMGCNQSILPVPIAENPWYFIFFPEGGALADQAMKLGVFDHDNVSSMLDALAVLARRHLFHYGLYKIEPGREPIAAK